MSDEILNDKPTRTQRQRKDDVVKKLAARLVELEPHHCEKLELTDQALEQIRFYRTLKAYGARKRQLKRVVQYIRDLDLDAIEQRLALAVSDRNQDKTQQHLLEAWRDGLIDDAPGTLEQILARCPDADRAKIKKLCNNARHERRTNSAPRSARLLFRYLRGLLDATQ